MPDNKSLAHRYSFSSGFSKYLSPKGSSSITAEITTNLNSHINKMSNEDIIKQTISWLVNEGFINNSDICETDIRHIKYAYPVYTLDHSQNLEIINKFFERVGINLLGRFAQFIYINSDVCISNARKLAKELSLMVSLFN